MNLLKKLFIPNGQKETVTAYESWVVRWTSRHGEYARDTREECEIFTTKEDAEKFATYLQELYVLYNSECKNLSQSNDSEIMSK